jgi:hypothetical protein
MFSIVTRALGSQAHQVGSLVNEHQLKWLPDMNSFAVLLALQSFPFFCWHQVRGDVARSLMYMAVSYGSGQKDGTPHLELSDSPSIR